VKSGHKPTIIQYCNAIGVGLRKWMKLLGKLRART